VPKAAVSNGKWPPYSITSSAVASSAVRTFKPSALGLVRGHAVSFSSDWGPKPDFLKAPGSIPAAAVTAEARLCGPGVPFLRWPSLNRPGGSFPCRWSGSQKQPDCARPMAAESARRLATAFQNRRFWPERRVTGEKKRKRTFDARGLSGIVRPKGRRSRGRERPSRQCCNCEPSPSKLGVRPRASKRVFQLGVAFLHAEACDLSRRGQWGR
jgi:hypothetical protein